MIPYAYYTHLDPIFAIVGALLIFLLAMWLYQYWRKGK